MRLSYSMPATPSCMCPLGVAGIETKSIAHSLADKNKVFVSTVENFVIIQQI